MSGDFTGTIPGTWNYSTSTSMKGPVLYVNFALDPALDLWTAIHDTILAASVAESSLTIQCPTKLALRCPLPRRAHVFRRRRQRLFLTERRLPSASSSLHDSAPPVAASAPTPYIREFTKRCGLQPTRLWSSTYDTRFGLTQNFLVCRSLSLASCFSVAAHTTCLKPQYEPPHIVESSFESVV